MFCGKSNQPAIYTGALAVGFFFFGKLTMCALEFFSPASFSHDLVLIALAVPMKCCVIMEDINGCCVCLCDHILTSLVLALVCFYSFRGCFYPQRLTSYSRCAFTHPLGICGASLQTQRQIKQAMFRDSKEFFRLKEQKLYYMYYSVEMCNI